MLALRWFAILAVFALQPFAPICAGEISKAGERLAKDLDSMDVENLWLAKQYVNWETGKALDKPVLDSKPHTHCSAFVAAACKRLGVYILRPPEHKETLLANAQFDWLSDKGAEHGWKRVHGPIEAQKMANEGFLVVASFKEKDATKSGHIAIVRPSKRGKQAIELDGPEVIQAGMYNHNSTTLKAGFKAHPSAWRDKQIRFYAHSL
jgi:hypothetical protein